VAGATRGAQGPCRRSRRIYQGPGSQSNPLT